MSSRRRPVACVEPVACRAADQPRRTRAPSASVDAAGQTRGDGVGELPSADVEQVTTCRRRDTRRSARPPRRRRCSTMRTCSGRTPSLQVGRAPALPTTFIGGVPMKRAANTDAGPRVELGRRRVLLDAARSQQHDLVRHAHRLDLVMRDVDHGHAELPLQRADLAPHLLAQLRVEVRQRLVHQADRRLGDDRAAERDALLLSARKLRRLAIEQRRSGPAASATRSAARVLGRRARGAP